MLDKESGALFLKDPRSRARSPLDKYGMIWEVDPDEGIEEFFSYFNLGNKILCNLMTEMSKNSKVVLLF